MSDSSMTDGSPKPVKETTAAPATEKTDDKPPTSPHRISERPTSTPEPTITAEEEEFLDKAKKHIGNRQSMRAFIQLLNLFANDLIDLEVLLYRARSFLGYKTELMNWFERWFGYDREEIMFQKKLRRLCKAFDALNISDLSNDGQETTENTLTGQTDDR